jgi:hypothetical protein
VTTNPVEQRWLELESELRKSLAGVNQISCHVPGWEPVDLEMGLRWLQSSIYEGYYVAYRIDASDNSATVRLKSWEYGEDEPEWRL